MGGNSQRLVDAAEVVPREIQRQHCMELFPFLRERVGQLGGQQRMDISLPANSVATRPSLEGSWRFSGRSLFENLPGFDYLAETRDVIRFLEAGLRENSWSALHAERQYRRKISHCIDNTRREIP